MPVGHLAVRSLRTASATLVISAAMSYPAIGLLHALQHHPSSTTVSASADHQHPTGTADHQHPTGSGDHQHATGSGPADAPVNGAGHVDHTAMAIVSGQMDGPSAPTNRTSAAPAGTGAHQHPAGLTAVTHWLRDAGLAVPVVFLALLTGAA
ncbi:MAG TPA: hypothetical protein VF755_13480, partial [Catenuloplanes sp.]